MGKYNNPTHVGEKKEMLVSSIRWFDNKNIGIFLVQPWMRGSGSRCNNNMICHVREMRFKIVNGGIFQKPPKWKESYIEQDVSTSSP